MCFHCLEGDAVVESFKIGLNVRETRIFYEYLKFLMKHIFQATYAEDKQSKEKKAEKNGNGKKPKSEKAKLAEEYIPEDIDEEPDSKPDPLESFDFGDK